MLESLVRALARKSSGARLPTVVALLLAIVVAPNTAKAVPTPPQTVSTFTLPQGSSTVTQSVSVSIAAGGNLTSVNVVTQGALPAGPYLGDFIDLPSAGDTCLVNSSYTNTTCSVTVQFQPQTPGRHFGAVVLTFGSGATATYAVQYLYGSSQGSLGVIMPGLIGTVAGSNNFLYSGDNGPAVKASIYLPLAEIVDAAGNLYISDSLNHRIRKVDTSGNITTYVGNGNAGSNGDGLAATSAAITTPSGLAIDGVGNLYFADSSTNEIRMVDANTMLISIVAGVPGAAGYVDGPVLQAQFTQPNGLVIDADQNLYIADTGNNVIRMIDLKVDPTQRQVVTIAGTQTPGFGGDGQKATKAVFNQPWGLAFGGDGYLYIADVNNNVIRRIDPTGVGLTATVVGVQTTQGSYSGDGGLASAAKLQNPEAVTVDLAGNIYVADTQNNVIRKATLQTDGTYQIATIAGISTTQTFAGDGGNSNAATMSAPSSLALDSAGNLYFGDLFHNRVRMISSQVSVLNYGQIKNSHVSAAKIETFENDGNAPMTLKPITFTYAQLDNASTCPTSATLASAASCTLDVEFAPNVPNLPAAGAQTAGAVTVPSDAANSPGTVSLTGDVLTVNPTTTTMATSGSPSALGDPVTFTATVTNGNSGAITGTVTFFDGQTSLGSGTLNGSGVASYTTTVLALGSHSITATYNDDANNAPSTSTPPVVQLVKTKTTLAVTSSLPPPNNATYPQTVTFTATLSGATTPVGGSITFSDGATLLATVTPSAAGGATSPALTLAPGTHDIVVSYTGDTNNLTSNDTLSQVVNQTPSNTAITVDNPSPTYGNAITLQATVTSTGPLPPTSPPTGSVTFTDSAMVGGVLVTRQFGPVTLPANGIATFPVTDLTPGPHSITAAYSGDTDNATSSTKTAASVTVYQIVTTVSVTSNANPANAATPIKLTATITGYTAAGGAVTGTVTFYDGTSVLKQVAVTNNSASYTVSLTPGTGPNAHQITATYSGATNYAGSNSNSTPYSLTVNQNLTTTKVASSVNPSIAGKGVTLTATVTAQTGGTIPTGTVQFTLNGTTSLGQAQLNASGQAVLTPAPVFSTGQNQTITATYAGDTNYGTSNGSVTQNVTQATTQITLNSSAITTYFGSNVIFTASLTGNGGQPTGSVTFLDGTATLGTVNLSGGTATYSTSVLSQGPHSITATYNGDTNDSTVTSAALVEQINKLPTTTTLSSNANPGTYSQPVTLSVMIASNVAPTGTVTFQNGSTVIGTSQVSTSGTNGTATLTLSNLPLGTQPIVAVYSGDANHVTSQSGTLNQQVLQAPGVVVTSSNPSSIAEHNVTLTANVTGIQNIVPTGTVVFKDGASALGSVPVSPAAGTVSATGVATFNTSSLAPGAHSIVATYSGDTNYKSMTSPPLSQNVIIANTTVSLASSANPATFHTPLTLTANVTGAGGSVTGTVTFMDGASTIGKSVVANGVATLTTTSLAPGQHTITAVYGGDSNNQPNSSSALQQQIEQTTVTTIVSSVNPALTLTPIVLTCSVNNGGTQPATGSVTLTDGSTLLGKLVLDGNGQATLSLPSLPAGQHNIVATYSGDIGDFPSTSAPFPQVVQLRPTTDVLTATTTSLTDGKQLTLISVLRWNGPVAPTGSVNFSIGNTVIGTGTIDKNGVATLTIVLDPGAATVVASYSGDSVYAASASPATGVTEGPPTSFTLQLSNSNITLQSKKNVTVNVTITSLQGFTDTLTLGCLGLPYAASCTFSTNQPTLQPNATQTVQVVIDTSAPLLAGTQQASTSGFAGGSRPVVLCVLLCSLLAGLLLMRSRRRHPLTGLLVLLCSIALVSALSGCGTIDVNGTPAGTYTFKVTASGTKTGITQSTDVTLTVQK